MNQNTTVFVVTKSVSYGLREASLEVVEVYLSREEAGCAAKSAERLANSGDFSFVYTHYSVAEVPVKTLDKTSKEFKAYVKDKLADLDEQIKRRRDCVVEDEASTKKLEEQKERLKALA